MNQFETEWQIVEKNYGVDATHSSFIHLVNTNYVRCHVMIQEYKEKDDTTQWEKSYENRKKEHLCVEEVEWKER